MKTFGTIIHLLAVAFLAAAQNNLLTGKVVWWGRDMIQHSYYSNHTNGVVESNDEILSNVVAIAGNTWEGLLLKSDGTVFGIGNNFQGGNDIPAGLSNVISIAAAGGSYWAIRRDGSVARWGNEPDEGNVVASLSNIVSVTWAGYRNYLALKTDGTVLGFRFDNPQPLVEQVKVRGRILSNVVALAELGYTPLVLKSDGTVFNLDYQTPGKPPVQPRYEARDNVLYEYLGAESAQLPYQYTSADPVIMDGRVLSNVVSLASGGGHALALKKDGAVVAWGNDTYGATIIPAGLTNVVAIAAAEHESLALKPDGTVVAWGGDYSQQLSVPAGLSNVVAIASGGDFNLALTTGKIPPSVFIQPHGRLEEMEQEADLVFKGQVISDSAITNAAFPDWGKPHATEFNVISVFKGKVHTNIITFLHITGAPMMLRGSSSPVHYTFETGRSYLVFAVQAAKSDWLYSPSTNHAAKLDEFRQIMRGDFAIRVLDSHPLNSLSVKEAHWFELNLLLNDTNPSNQLYAIDKLDGMCMRGDQHEEWRRSGDFKRQRILTALLPLVTNQNEQVATRAINCFATSSNADARLEPFAEALINVANNSPSATRRLTSIEALSGIGCDAVSNSLVELLQNTDGNIRARAVQLLPRFQKEFSELTLRELADDKSAKVRSAVADVIGNEKNERLLPVLAKLFTDPVGRQNPIGMKVEDLEAGSRVVGIEGGTTMVNDPTYPGVNIGDVHTSAGYALLKFDVEQVREILKTNISDKGFSLSFIRKLAPNGAEPYFPLLAKELKAHTAGSEQEAAKNGFHWNLSYWLMGNYGWAWDTLFAHVSAQSREALANPQFAPMLDALQIADDPGDAKTRSLYAFFLDKGLIERATELRHGIIRRTEDKNINRESFGFPEKLKAFDEIDKQHSLKPGLGL